MRASPDLRMGIELILLPRRPRLEIRASRSPGVALDAFENQGNSLAHTDAHGAERKSAIGSQKLVERGGYKPRAGSTQGVPKSDRTTVRIHVRRVARNS